MASDPHSVDFVVEQVKDAGRMSQGIFDGEKNMEMKMFKRVLLPIILLTSSPSSYAGPGDMVGTSSRVIKEVRIQNTPSGATYYFVAEGDWAVANCAGVLYPYIAENAPGPKAVLSAALTSKSTGSPLSFTGICGDSAGDTQYLQIKYTIF